ncbi:hypothetical protein DICPUDRAFT_35527 [Dictyostelium purpureum]|uniref:Nas2 N-terminal domain-containing protein n=1 Tax=Dictyostelium purpureum TaxID=5786 RepID=F0ZPD6_DICPU|nr:uncharacterized protein DICPUDRAFT_35527 [Dictyostelium purpureum]EGC34184.1 hypothetical protein DICPUDRAFT_35527 [Dictyostelium purpureum]|eukprot:XP_003289288.1 hypothetical protein DICPUDRAFT_35527 [Dictyostelium purpureum]
MEIENNNNITNNDNESDTETIQRLMKQRSEMEKELEGLMEFLKSGNGKQFGLKGSFVDSEGYPSPHLELIIEVKKARSRIAHLQNDYKELMKNIEDHLQKLHKKSPIQQSQTSSINSGLKTNEDKMDIENNNSSPIPIPFVYIDLVTEGSPSDKAGFKRDDLIYQFGTVGPFYNESDCTESKNTNHLQSIATIVRNSENRAISIKLLRGNNQKVSTSLIPRKWNGQGLIG